MFKAHRLLSLSTVGLGVKKIKNLAGGDGGALRGNFCRGQRQLFSRDHVHHKRRKRVPTIAR